MSSMSRDGREFTPAIWLRNPHFMTVFPGYWPRPALLAGIPTESRLFTTEPQTQLLGYCHWQPHRTACQTLVLVHGLEGCCESHYMRGIAAKAFRAGCNVIRMNQRTCGGTEHLTPTLYNLGLSQDYRAIVQELGHVDGLNRIWLVGYSMGGNLILKAAGEAGRSESALAGTVAVCPNIDPPQCVEALEEPRNWIYHRHFLVELKARLRRKAAFSPGKWDLTSLDTIDRLRDFDDRYTAPDGGYAGSTDYYARTGAQHVLDTLAVPTLIITAQDDPFIPYQMFTGPQIQRHPKIRVLAPRYGGHCGFFHRSNNGEDPYWAENRIIDFVQGQR
ncbi:MAG: alpha/beta fold hydrolase [Nitrospira sp. CG24E]|nr:MAG: alpha/beta fold hydrolase [Nitrospira sp. CG24E]